MFITSIFFSFFPPVWLSSRRHELTISLSRLVVNKSFHFLFKVFWSTLVAQQASKSVKKMTTQEAIDYYGSVKKLADELGVWPQVIYRWVDSPPPGRQYELEIKTGGKLKADKNKK